MTRLLILTHAQFGYLTDTYQYCRYLRHDFEITYLCWDYRDPRVVEDGITVIYVPRKGSKIRRLARLIIWARRELRSGFYDVAFVVYFQLCAFVGLGRNRRRTVLDIRTGYVRHTGLRRRLHNLLLSLETLAFPRVTVISESLREELRVGKHRSHIVPVGATDMRLPEKRFDTLRLLYVGTLQYRFLERTVEGFSSFCATVDEGAEASYEIVGGGEEGDVARLQRAIEASPFRDRLRYMGRIPHAELGPFLARNNVGVAFIPVTDQFEHQPATKVFEYLLAGMPVVATATLENRRVITDCNGVLTDDTAEGFSRGLQRLYERRGGFSSLAIKATATGCTWEEIVLGNLRPYLRRAAD